MSVTDYTTNRPAKDNRPPDDLALNDIVRFFINSRWTVAVATLFGLVVGAVYAFSKPNVYTAQVTVMPEIQAKGAGGLGSLGSLAGLAGVNLDNLGGQQEIIPPDLYPTIVQTVPFALYLLKQSVYSQKLNASIPLQKFIEHSADDGFASQLFSSFSGSDQKTDGEDKKTDPRNLGHVLQITRQQDELIKTIQASVVTAYEKKTGVVTISATEPDPIVAATVARLSLDYLTKYLVNYQTEKTRRQVSFLVRQVADAQSRYRATEYSLSAYRDHNRSLFLNTAKIDEQRLQADYMLAQSVYTDLSKQLEQAKIKVQEATPVFEILEPPTVPLVKSGPKRTAIMLAFAIAGALLSIGILLIRQLQRSYLTTTL